MRTALIGVIALGMPLLAGHQLAQPAYADGTITVTSPADNETEDNELTLREALRLATEGLDGGIHNLTVAELAACGAGCGGAYLPGPVSDDTIVFGGDYTIEVDCAGLGALPDLSDDDADNEGDTIDGSGRTVTIKPAGACAVVGLDLSGDANTVRGVRITDSTEDGAGNGFTIGIRISGNSNLVDNGTGGEACQVGGATTDGIQISGDVNTIRDCFVGTDATGHGPAVPNADDGIDIAGGLGNFIGGNDSGNVISGNAGGPNSEGILVRDGALSTSIIDNMIGVDVEGDTDLGNQGDGIDVNDGFAAISQGVDGTRTNIIGGNGASGIRLGLDSSDASITNNYIGTNAANSTAIGNTLHGVEIVQASDDVNIEDNTIGNNGGSGVLLDGDDSGHLVDDNFIGTNAAGGGGVDLGNGDNGVLAQLDPGTNSTISDNVIRFNGSAATEAGINVQSGGVTTISGNTIRDQQVGGAPGVLLAGGTTNTLSLNTIAGNSGGGIQVTGGTTNNLSSDTITFNAGDGIFINGGSTNNVGPGDTISDNSQDGIQIGGGCAAGCDVNIGITTDGGADNTIASNGRHGINVNGGGEDIDIGSAGVGGDNDILSNTESGIRISGVSTVEVRENLIDDNNTPIVGGNAGILIIAGTSVLIGGVNDGNTISDNGGANIHAINGSATIQGNTISGASSPNVRVNTAGSVLIGGTAVGQGNTISGATGSGDGVSVLDPTADTTRILGNTFSGNAGQSIDLDDNGVTCTNPNSNGGIDCPVITEASSDAETVSGTYNLADCPNPCRIEVYQVTTDNDGNGEGNILRDSFTATGGAFSRDLGVSVALDIETGDVFTATASNTTATSEFSLNATAVPTEGIYQFDIVFLINQAAKNAAGAGDDVYGAEDSGAGGQNNKITKGPTFKRPKGANPPIEYSFAATKKNTTTYIRSQNDGTVTDQVLFHSLECTRTTKAGTVDCDALTGLILEVMGVNVGEARALQSSGGTEDGDILLTVSTAALAGEYVVILNFRSVGDTSKFDSVTLRFKIK